MIRDFIQLSVALALILYGIASVSQARADSTTICTKTQSGIVCTTTTTSHFPGSDKAGGSHD